MKINRNQTIWSAALIALLATCSPHLLAARHGRGEFGWGLGVGLGVGLGYPYGYRGYYYGGYPYYYQDYYRPAYTRYNTYYISSPSYSSVQYTTATNATDQIIQIQSEYNNYRLYPGDRQEIKGRIKTIRSQKEEIEVQSHRSAIEIYFDRDGRLHIG